MITPGGIQGVRGNPPQGMTCPVGQKPVMTDPANQLWQCQPDPNYVAPAKTTAAAPAAATTVTSDNTTTAAPVSTTIGGLLAANYTPNTVNDTYVPSPAPAAVADTPAPTSHNWLLILGIIALVAFAWYMGTHHKKAKAE